MSGLHAAATALIAEADETTVAHIIRQLLDAIAPAAARTPKPSTQHPARAKPTANAKPVAVTPLDPEWAELRGRVRAAMAERGLDYAGLAQIIGGSATALRVAITSRKPPRLSAQAKLRSWLAEAPVVATPIPFRSSHRANGNGSSAYVNAASGRTLNSPIG